jgi:hypothetical protein
MSLNSHLWLVPIVLDCTGLQKSKDRCLKYIIVNIKLELHRKSMKARKMNTEPNVEWLLENQKSNSSIMQRMLRTHYMKRTGIYKGLRVYKVHGR